MINKTKNCVFIFLNVVNEITKSWERFVKTYILKTIDFILNKSPHISNLILNTISVIPKHNIVIVKTVSNKIGVYKTKHIVKYDEIKITCVNY